MPPSWRSALTRTNDASVNRTMPNVVSAIRLPISERGWTETRSSPDSRNPMATNTIAGPIER